MSSDFVTIAKVHGIASFVHAHAYLCMYEWTEHAVEVSRCA